jgi:tRNA(Ile)-lysidine synthetase-like protein
MANLPYFPIALAISGGVDSMAMAYLFSSLLKVYKGIKIADNPAESAFGVVVDHKLREESTQEASRVTHELKQLGLKAVIKPLNWREHRWNGTEPTTLPNVESLARTMRYQALGSTCRYLQADSLFFAHHQDDQYETVLMRLLAGHGYRGLQGIREANAIPECYELHDVYKSGLLDDQMQKYPFLSFKPPSREMKRLRYILKDDKNAESWDEIKSYLSQDDASTRFPGHISREYDPSVPYLTPLQSEDGGVMIYRPLLEFDKGRLIATCEANGVRWFEDRTNTDPTLTTRNAIRQITRVHTLPKALQKPSILALAHRSRQRAQLEEAEAHRLLVRENVIRDFDPNAGTLLIDVSTLWREKPHQMRRPFAQAREEARKRSRRLIASLAVRKLIAFVTPELHLPPLTNLDNAVERLFPYLSDMPDTVPVAQPKAFSIAGVLFEPVIKMNSVTWLLSRAPYSSRQPLPERKLPGYLNYRDGVLRLDAAIDQPSRLRHWRGWKTAKLWDGRFWIRVSACIAAKFHVLPFLASSAKPFRMALPPRERANLEKVLKHYAPGKVRYSLPALYSVEATGDDEDSEQIMTLLALPTLGIHVPGLERWVKYEARYRNIDITLLGTAKKKQNKASPLGYTRPTTKRQGTLLRAQGIRRSGRARQTPGAWEASTSL